MATATKSAPVKDANAEDPKDAAGDGSKGKGGKKKLLMIVAVVLLAAGGAWFFLLRGGGPPPPPVPGVVVALEPVTLNLADGHYLKLGLALQATKAAKEAPDGSKALDIAIAMLSDRPPAELTSAKARAEVKKKLVEKVDEAYEHEVMDVYFTQFVMN